ncbi:unnamed protein product [Acanthosepion pharaonis]|uniref:Uncharacterized protein n=1 Tax=Acanthosepion pharaonis TaxID=158019 RepID=A0A812ENB3_ACAPH|nr:unnamed protein product [Sepia pharaonis]
MFFFLSIFLSFFSFFIACLLSFFFSFFLILFLFFLSFSSPISIFHHHVLFASYLLISHSLYSVFEIICSLCAKYFFFLVVFHVLFFRHFRLTFSVFICCFPSYFSLALFLAPIFLAYSSLHLFRDIFPSFLSVSSIFYFLDIFSLSFSLFLHCFSLSLFSFCFNCRASFSTRFNLSTFCSLLGSLSLSLLVLSFLSIFPATIFFLHISSTYKMADLFTATEGDAHFSFNSRENQNRHFSLNKAIEKQLSLAY